MARNLVTAGLLLLLAGCRSSQQVTIPEMGFSMKLPLGWRVDSKDKTSFYKTTRAEENYGWVVEHQLEEGEDLTLAQDCPETEWALHTSIRSIEIQ
jgi:hypothetical protein